jgi:hypothetical protein
LSIICRVFSASIGEFSFVGWVYIVWAGRYGVKRGRRQQEETIRTTKKKKQ